MNQSGLAPDFENKLFAWLHAGDPVLKWLGPRLPITPVKMWSAGFLITFVLLQIIYPWTTGQLFSSAGAVGALDDSSGLFFRGILTPSIWAFYAWIPGAIAAVFGELKRNRVVAVDEKPEAVRLLFPTNKAESSDAGTDLWDKLLWFLGRTSEKYVWVCLAVILMAASSIFVHAPLYLNAYPKWWFARDPTFLFLVFYPISGLAAPMLALTVIRHTLLIAWLTKLFRTVPIDVHPLHPDNSGGLGAIGDYSLKTAYLVSVVALDITLVGIAPIARGQRFQLSAELVLYYTLYLTLAPLLFVAPALAAHRAMKVKKREMLLNISRQFEEVYDRASTEPDETALDKQLKRLQELQALYELTQRTFPVWPFDFGVVRRFIAVTITPVIPSILLDLAWRFFLPVS